MCFMRFAAFNFKFNHLYNSSSTASLDSLIELEFAMPACLLSGWLFLLYPSSVNAERDS